MRTLLTIVLLSLPFQARAQSTDSACTPKFTFGTNGVCMSDVDSYFTVGVSSFAVMAGSVLVGTTTALVSRPMLEIYSSSMTVSVSTQGAFDVSGGPVPTFVGCGTTPTITAGSNCQRGSLTMTTGLASTCTMTLPAACFSRTPLCNISGGSAGLAAVFQQTGNTTTSCTTTLGLTNCAVGAFFSWNCWGN